MKAALKEIKLKFVDTSARSNLHEKETWDPHALTSQRRQGPPPTPPPRTIKCPPRFIINRQAKPRRPHHIPLTRTKVGTITPQNLLLWK
jgi:hypothetical protein